MRRQLGTGTHGGKSRLQALPLRLRSIHQICRLTASSQRHDLLVIERNIGGLRGIAV